MDFFLIVLIYVFSLIFLANWAVRKNYIPTLYRWLVGVLFCLLGISILLVVASGRTIGTQPPTLSPQQAIGYGTMAGVAFIFCLSISLDAGFRRVLKATVFRHTAYDPNSVVHTLALIFIIAELIFVFGTFIQNDGLAGIAAQTAAESESAPNYSSFGIDLGIYTVLTLVGVGLFTRRGIRASLRRLGVRFPGMGECAAGIGMGVAMRMYTILFSLLVTTVVLPAVGDTENSTALWGASISTHSTLLYGFLLALTSGIGEELVYRGAFQPIFGVWVTALAFVLVHTNYTFTLTWGIIGVHALIFAWLRQQANTTTAMIAHFTYNFMPYVLMALWA